MNAEETRRILGLEAPEPADPQKEKAISFDGGARESAFPREPVRELNQLLVALVRGHSRAEIEQQQREGWW